MLTEVMSWTNRSNIRRLHWRSVCRCHTCQSCWCPTSCGRGCHGGRRTVSLPSRLYTLSSSDRQTDRWRTVSYWRQNWLVYTVCLEPSDALISCNIRVYKPLSKPVDVTHYSKQWVLGPENNWNKQTSEDLHLLKLRCDQFPVSLQVHIRSWSQIFLTEVTENQTVDI